ncbi:MAG TPA: DUF4124 domain-containing protein [Burkholderiaceae bacterium]|nr:DUF4124 domain-containing protein [Burkholderiaceae bacterium]
MTRLLPMRLIFAVLLTCWLGQGAAQGIFTCLDSKGRKITSDRPIPECNDREQKELNPSGTVKRNVGPSLTAQERTLKEEQEKKEAEERARAADEKRRDRALLNRYQNKAVHDRERVDALKQVDEVIAAASKRVLELGQQRAAIENEMEFYKKDTSKAPPSIRRQVTENEQNIALQKRFIVDQETEKSRINARFDEELVRLRQLWAIQAAAISTATGTAARPASAPAAR